MIINFIILIYYRFINKLQISQQLHLPKDSLTGKCALTTNMGVPGVWHSSMTTPRLLFSTPYTPPTATSGHCKGTHTHTHTHDERQGNSRTRPTVRLITAEVSHALNHSAKREAGSKVD